MSADWLAPAVLDVGWNIKCEVFVVVESPRDLFIFTTDLSALYFFSGFLLTASAYLGPL